MPDTPLPTVIVEDQNMPAQVAGERARDAHGRVARAARRLTEELDEVTEVGRGPGVPIAELGPEDSLVIAVVALRKTRDLPEQKPDPDEESDPDTDRDPDPVA